MTKGMVKGMGFKGTYLEEPDEATKKRAEEIKKKYAKKKVDENE